MATNWNAILSNANSLADILMILRKVLAGLDAKADLTTIDEAIEEINQVRTDVDEKIEYIDRIINESIESGLYMPFSKQVDLLAYVPSAEPVVGKAFDTFKVWLWETRSPDTKPKWHDTGLSELDRARNYNDQKLGEFSDLSKLRKLPWLDENTLTKDGVVNPEWFITAQHRIEAANAIRHIELLNADPAKEYFISIFCNSDPTFKDQIAIGHYLLKYLLP